MVKVFSKGGDYYAMNNNVVAVNCANKKMKKKNNKEIIIMFNTEKLRNKYVLGLFFAAFLLPVSVKTALGEWIPHGDEYGYMYELSSKQSMVAKVAQLIMQNNDNVYIVTKGKRYGKNPRRIFAEFLYSNYNLHWQEVHAFSSIIDSIKPPFYKRGNGFNFPKQGYELYEDTEVIK